MYTYKKIIETIDAIIKKRELECEIDDAEQKILDDLIINNILFDDYLKLNYVKNKEENNLKNNEYIKKFNENWSSFANVLKGETFELDENGQQFYRDLKKLYKYEIKGSNPEYNTFGDFTLELGDWNDYGHRNTVFLKCNGKLIDCIKVIFDESFEKTSRIDFDDIIFSIGWKPEYYEKVEKLFSNGEQLKDFFTEIKDITSFSSEKYKNLKEKYKDKFDESIYRYQSTRYKEKEVLAEQLNKNLYLNNSEIEVDFDSLENMGNRVVVLIGENGVGKTRNLKKMYKENIGRGGSNENILQENMDYKKHLYFSFATFDLKDDISEESNVYFLTDFLSESNYYDIIKNELLFINRDRSDLLMEVIDDFFDESEYLTIFKDEFELFLSGEITYNEIYEYFSDLSTGQKYIIFFFTALISNIMNDSLIYIDEIENSQHPNNILKIMKNIERVLEKYNSKAIISTHSHLIIQAIPKEAVLWLKKDEENKMEFVKLSSETFGRDFGELMERIFNLSTKDYYYYNKLENYMGNSDDELDLSFLTKGHDFDSMYLKQLIGQIKEES